MDSRKREADEEGEAFLHVPQSGSSESVAADPSTERPWHGGRNGRGRGPTWYLRLLLEISMAVTIVYLVVAKPFIVSRETIRLSPVPRCKLRTSPRLPEAAADPCLLSSSAQDPYISR